MRRNSSSLSLILLAALAPGVRGAGLSIEVGEGPGRPLSLRLFGASLPGPGTPGAASLLPEMVRNGSFEQPALRGPLEMPPGWKNRGGWELRACGARNVVVRTRVKEDEPLVLVARRKWRDYHLSILARKTGGPGGIRILLEVQDERNHVRWTLGARGNTRHIVETVGQGRPRLMAPPVAGHIETGRLYHIDLSVRAGTLFCSLDGRMLHRIGRATKPFAGVGLGAAGATAEFMALRVEKPGGDPLFLLDDPAAAPLDQLAEGWRAVRAPGSRVRYTWDHVYPFNSHFCQGIRAEEPGGDVVGVAQGRFSVRRGLVYVGEAHLRGRGLPRVWAELRGKGEEPAARADLGQARERWTRRRFRLAPSFTDPDAELVLAVEGRGAVWVDQLSLAPEGERPWLKSAVLAALKRLRPSLLRWPAGPGGMDYEWRRGFGPAAKRPVCAAAAVRSGRFVPAPNTFGTGEFVALCRELGAEPLLVVSPRMGGRAAADWVEYCEGEASSPMGQRRAANGREHPFGVRLWVVAADPAAGDRDDRASALAAKMLAAVPTVSVVAPGAAAGGVGRAGRFVPWEARIAARDAGRALGELAKRISALRAKGAAPALMDIRAEGRLAAAAAAAAMVVAAREGGPGAMATAPLLSRANSVAGLVTIRGDAVGETALARAFRLLRAHLPAELLPMKAATGGDVWTLAGQSEREVVVWAVNCATEQRTLEVSGLPVGEAGAVEHRSLTAADGAEKTRRLQPRGERLRCVLPPASVNVFSAWRR